MQIRIHGLVTLARTIQAELTRPTGRAEQLRALASDVLSRVRGFLKEKHASIADLPRQTRDAYAAIETFLHPDAAPRPAAPAEPRRRLNMAAFPLSPKLAAARPEPLSLPGLSTHVNQSAAKLSTLPDAGATALLASRIGAASRRAEKNIVARQLSAGDLSPETRQSRAWLAYFAHPENVDRYLHAVRLALPLLRHGAPRRPRLVPDASKLVVLFKPLHGYYVLRRSVLVLPTPMIAFDEAKFGVLAEMVFGNGRDAKDRMFHSVMSPEFQHLRRELDHLGGMVHRPVGLAHDLAESFDRVNARYFDGAMSRPTMVWSRKLTGRKFGHYDYIQDTVMLSRSLDHPEVPGSLVDFIMYHELLHKKHGVRWTNGQHRAHTREFRAEERRFEGHEEAERMLQELAEACRRR